MNCEFVQERLSAFLDREESTDNIESALTHLYGCESCQNFFNAAVRLRSIASDNREVYPAGLDEAILRRVHENRKTNFLKYRLRLPAYVMSAAAAILIVISFAFGFMVNRSISEREMRRILSSQGFYIMPQQTVYPVMSREFQGGDQ